MTHEHEREEWLETIGTHLERGKNDSASILKHDITRHAFSQLQAEGLLRVTPDDKIEWTPEGEKIYHILIRRHRLAERLLHDVLSIKDETSIENQACEFEHILDHSVTDHICTLLGHPTTCPHGKPIPPGECCRNHLQVAEPIVTTLDKLQPGDAARIVYISTADHSKVDKLSSMGVMPGVSLRVHQIKPAFVVLFGETTLSMDEQIAREIHVRRTDGDQP